MNLRDAQTHLQRLGAVAQQDQEDAVAAQRLADEDAARLERFYLSMRRLQLKGVAPTIAVMREQAQGRKKASQDRAAQCAATVSDTQALQKMLAEHLAIRDKGQGAGGLAEREAYAQR